MSVADVGLQELQRILEDEQRLVLVDFWGPWCAPCRTMKPHIERLAQERVGDTRIVAVNVDKEPEAAEHYDIQGLPTYVLFRQGQPVQRLTESVPPSRLAAELDALTTDTDTTSGT